MSQPSKHPKTIDFEHCWICQVKFVGFGGTEPVEHHHVVPRANGGTDGPTVSLCTAHHTKLHKIAIALKASKPYFTLLVGEDAERSKKILYLANCVYNADLATRNDPNKAALLTMNLNAVNKSMLDQLRPIYPQCKSREALMLLALSSLHKKHFVQ